MSIMPTIWTGYITKKHIVLGKFASYGIQPIKLNKQTFTSVLPLVQIHLLILALAGP